MAPWARWAVVAYACRGHGVPSPSRTAARTQLRLRHASCQARCAEDQAAVARAEGFLVDLRAPGSRRGTAIRVIPYSERLRRPAPASSSTRTLATQPRWLNSRYPTVDWTARNCTTAGTSSVRPSSELAMRWSVPLVPSIRSTMKGWRLPRKRRCLPHGLRSRLAVTSRWRRSSRRARGFLHRRRRTGHWAGRPSGS